MHVLICIARDPDARVRDIAELVGITDRAVQRIIAELEEGGVIEHEKIGRRNRYSINLDSTLRHPLEEGTSIRELLRSMVKGRLLRAASMS